MLVKIEQIREEGLHLEEPLSLELLADVLSDQAGDTGFRPVRPATLTADFHKVSGGVLLRGKARIDVAAECKRCLTPVTRAIPVDFTLNLVPASLYKAEQAEAEGEGEGQDKGQAESGGSFALDAADRDVFDGKKIELDPIVREQVLLALPMSVVCKEDCRGLCITCGQNLNERDCGHSQRVLDPRLAALKDIKLN